MATSIQVKVQGSKDRSIVFEDKKGSTGKINDKDFSIDVQQKSSQRFHVIKDNTNYDVEVLKADLTEKSFIIKVNGNKYALEAKDQFDQLLDSLGLSNLKSHKVNEIKAPMPGLVLEIRIQPGDEIKKGDPVIVLEAMKMENILKSPTDGVIKSINVQKGVAVEKNQVLINFE